jgi:hypothetical protein
MTSLHAALAPLLLIAAAGLARADTSLPGAPSAPAPSRAKAAGAETRWPAVLPCARPTLLATASEHPDDVLSWSSARGAPQRIAHLGDKRPRRLSRAFEDDRPTRLAWEKRRARRPADPSCPTEDRCSRQAQLTVTCEDGPGSVDWLCDDKWSEQDDYRPCYPSVTYPYASTALQRAHDDPGRVTQVLRDPDHARDAMIGHALALIDEACAGQRCTVRVAAVADRLRVLRHAPAWSATRAEPRTLTLVPTAGGPSDDTLTCSSDAYLQMHECVLKVGAIELRLDAKSSWYREMLSDKDGNWYVAAELGGISLHDEAIR